MVEKSEILSGARNLEGYCWVLEPRGKAIWKGKSYGATFELTKPEGKLSPVQKDTSHLILSLEGNAKGKQQLRAEFIEALGEPDLETPAKKSKETILIWNSTKVLKSEAQ